jgi:multisubunit Na+/H+ antiporter MnhB subunit
LVGLILVFSVYLLFRGHNAPGGGFSAALVAATAFALFAIAEGPGPVYQALRIEPRVLIAWGLLLAVCSGLIAVVDRQALPDRIVVDAAGFSRCIGRGNPLIF